MSIGVYPKLAWNGIKKNKKLYLPYLLTCTGMIMIFYIIAFLAQSSAAEGMRGVTLLQALLNFGTWIIGIFSLIFLFYTNSFLIRRRKKEFGLYNILGMGKANIGGILVWETLITAGISLAAGLSCGILFSKAAELCLAKILQKQSTLRFAVNWEAFQQCILVFAVIFLLILLNSLRQVRTSKPVELLHSENFGEKPPKANWVLAVLGVILIAAAYYFAAILDNPLDALIFFFILVIMVIVGTYMLFVAGSVAICKLLQKNKRYYYKTNHFISVSSMSYRMKRNGAGLASICILSTMVLVMISSTACLFIGTEDSLNTYYPRDITIHNEDPNRSVETIRSETASVLEEHRLQPENLIDYRYLSFTGYLEGQKILLPKQLSHSADIGKIYNIYIIPLEDYNRNFGRNETLGRDEILLRSNRNSYTDNTIVIEGYREMKVKKILEEPIPNGKEANMIVDSIFMIVSDEAEIEQMQTFFKDKFSVEDPMITTYYAFDVNTESEEEITLYQDLYKRLETSGSDKGFSMYSKADESSVQYELNGGFFFLGIFLGLIFIAATVLIIYYKQISEGYEDQNRFEIMQKVGMTKKEIRKSINSQILTVFFLPLAAAGIHTAFAFPIISRMLTLFSIQNLPLLICGTIAAFLIFAFFYMIVYKITSKAYYDIVSGGKGATA